MPIVFVAMPYALAGMDSFSPPTFTLASFWCMMRAATWPADSKASNGPSDLTEIANRVQKDELVHEDSIECKPEQADPAVDYDHINDIPGCWLAAFVGARQAETKQRVVAIVAAVAQNALESLTGTALSE